MSIDNASSNSQRVIDSLVTAVRSAVQANVQLHPSDDDPDFASVVTATRAALRRRSRSSVSGENATVGMRKPVDL